MKKTIAIVLMLALVTVMYGCKSSSPRGGSVVKGEGFKIAAPAFVTVLKQGEIQNVTLGIQRGEYFKQDVKLEIEAPKGIEVEPTSIVVRANEKPETVIRISAPTKAAIGEYRVFVKGIPKTGGSTSTEFMVKVVAP